MGKKNGAQGHDLKELVRQRFGEKDKEILEEHFVYIVRKELKASIIKTNILNEQE